MAGDKDSGNVTQRQPSVERVSYGCPAPEVPETCGVMVGERNYWTGKDPLLAQNIQPRPRRG